MLFALAVWAVIRFMRRLTPESLESDPTGGAVARDRDERNARRPASRDVARRASGAPGGPGAALVRRSALGPRAPGGGQRDPAMTPAEFAPGVAAAYPESAPDFDALTRAYEDVRYGSAHLDRARLRELDAHRRRIIAAIRRRAPEARDATPPDL